jgi:signal transduction histidine kinase
MNTLGRTRINALRRSVLLFFKKIVAPKSESEDDKRREYILNIILVTSIALLSLLDSLVLLRWLSKGDSYNGISFFAFSFILAMFGFLYFLSRKGYFLFVSYILVSLYFFNIVHVIYKWGVDVPSALLGFALVIVISSVLISTRFSFVVTLLSSLFLILFAILDTRGIIHSNFDWRKLIPDAYDGVAFSAILFLITIVSWLSNKEIERSLARARKSEEALKHERDQLEMKVEERTKELKQAQIEKMAQVYRFAEFGKLSSGLFHDLVNPLTAVALNIESLKKLPGQHFEEAKPYLDKALSASKRMEDFILALRKQIQKQEIQSQFVLNEEIEQSMELLGYKARKIGISLRLIAPEIIETYGNPLKFYQIIANLISNAIDAYESFSPANDSLKHVLISLHEKEGLVTIIVKDWGKGIEESLLNQIFEPFFTTKSSERGSGIGLATAKDIVEKHFDGKIYVESKVGSGTIFSIEFKIRTEPTEEQKIEKSDLI